MCAPFKIFGFLLIGCFLCTLTAFSQEFNKDSLKKFRKNYIKTHDVVKGDSVKYLRFYPIKKAFVIPAEFIPLAQPEDYKMPTSSGISKAAFKIGYLQFQLNGQDLKLSVYQLKSLMQTVKYHDDVFTPFTDLTSGISSYGGGRYLDFTLSEIQNPSFIIDFNKAYNPSCIYAGGFNCPIPPRENDLPVKIKAGEKIYALYAKKHPDLN
jgi:uncharacterized protein (DUF1684 family)